MITIEEPQDFTMFISIITLNYKKSDMTLECIKSVFEVFREEFAKDMMEMIIVDNASGDDSVKLLTNEIENKKYKNVKLIANKQNDGFGKGCNIGEQKAGGNYILFLNNDTVVKDRGIYKMAEYLDTHPDVAILGGQLRNTDGTLQPSAGGFYTPFKILLLLLGMQRFGFLDKSPGEISKVDWVKGGLLMIKKDVFDSLGGFDEKIFMYAEDMELCYRAREKGYLTYFYPDVLVLHKEHGSTNRTFAIVNIYKNLLYFYKKHKSGSEYLFVKFLMLTKANILVILGSILGNKYLKDTYKEAKAAIA